MDDTAKDSGVLDLSVLIENTFANAPKVPKGFPELYRHLDTHLTIKGSHPRLTQRPFFMYLSAAPWQLYPILTDYIQEYYPPGQLLLNSFSFGGPSTLRASVRELKNSQGYKTSRRDQLYDMFPTRKLILIGDLGERDRFVYRDAYCFFFSVT